MSSAAARSSKSDMSYLRIDEQQGKATTSVGQRVRHRASRDTQRLGDLGLWQVGDISQHEHLTLTFGQITNSHPRLARSRRNVTRRNLAPQQAGFEQRTANAPTSHVDANTHNPTAGRLHAPDRRPSTQRPNEGLIGGISSTIEIARHEQQRGQHSRVRRLVPLLESTELKIHILKSHTSPRMTGVTSRPSARRRRRTLLQ